MVYEGCVGLLLSIANAEFPAQGVLAQGILNPLRKDTFSTKQKPGPPVERLE